MSGACFSPASQRNLEPVLGVLRHEFAARRCVLEIGSGCGYHALSVAAAMPWLVWQPSDLPGQLAMLGANLATIRVANVLPPIALDMVQSEAPGGRYDAVYTANTAHIMSMNGVRGLFRCAADVLDTGGCLACYGPFRRAGRFNAPSNADFDRALRARDPESGIRDLEALDEIAAAVSLERARIYAMPSNNLLVTWAKTA